MTINAQDPVHFGGDVAADFVHHLSDFAQFKLAARTDLSLAGIEKNFRLKDKAVADDLESILIFEADRAKRP